MQALHSKLDVVLVQILRYNCSEADYSLCEDSPPSRTPPATRMWVSPSDPFSPPTIFFAPPPVVLVTLVYAVTQSSCPSQGPLCENMTPSTKPEVQLNYITTQGRI